MENENIEGKTKKVCHYIQTSFSCVLKNKNDLLSVVHYDIISSVFIPLYSSKIVERRGRDILATKFHFSIVKNAMNY